MYNAPRKRFIKSRTYNVCVMLENESNEISYISQIWRVNGQRPLLNTKQIIKFYIDQGYTNVMIHSISEVDSQSYKV